MSLHTMTMLLFDVLNQPHTLMPLILLVIVLGTNIYTGPLTLFKNHKWHPLNILESLIVWCDEKLNRENRSPSDRLIRGGLTSIIIFLFSGLFGYLVTCLSQALPLAWIFEIILLLIIVDQNIMFKNIKKIYKSLKNNDTTSARQIIGDITPENQIKMDSFSIARTSIEVLATSLVIRLFAPTFWYVLFGAAGIVSYHAVTMLNTRINHNHMRYKDFGLITKYLNITLLILPCLLAGHLIFIASLFVPKTMPVGSYINMIKYVNKYYSFNLGFIISAVAGALGLALSGPKTYGKTTRNKPWIGHGTAMATHHDIRRSLHLYTTVCLINVLIIASIILIKQI